MSSTMPVELINSYTVCFTALLLGAFAAFWRRTKWIRIGRSPGPFGLKVASAKNDFALHGRALLREGYRKHQGKSFVIQSANKEVLIVAPRFLPELRMLPETKLSHAQILMDYWVSEHIGGDLAMEGALHIDAVRGPLTKSLKSQVPIMQREYRRTSEFLFSQVPKDSNQLNVYGFCYALVSSITSTIFIGEELAHGGGWDKIVMAYFPVAWQIRSALKPWPRVLRPMVKPFLVRDASNQLEAILQQAESFLAEPIRRRREPDNQDLDILKFLSEYDSSPRKIALQIVGIITGALNTSTHALMQAVFDLCAHPEYVADLRAEATAALDSEGGQWTYGAVKKLHLLDSFMKESLRLFAPEGMAITRLATSSITLSDGTYIPRGTSIAVAGEAMALDPEFYGRDPEQFDGRRFLNADGKPVSPEREFHGIEPGNAMWGAGRLTCPGRHYASALAKLILANLLLKYDVSFPPGQKESPRGAQDDGNLVPDMAQMIVLAERA